MSVCCIFLGKNKILLVSVQCTYVSPSQKKMLTVNRDVSHSSQQMHVCKATALQFMALHFSYKQNEQIFIKYIKIGVERSLEEDLKCLSHASGYCLKEYERYFYSLRYSNVNSFFCSTKFYIPFRHLNDFIKITCHHLPLS